jgi:hypothetical protein
MNYNLKLLLFCTILTNFLKNFTSAEAESSRSLTIGQEYVFPDFSSPSNPFAQQALDIGIITAEKFANLHSATKEKNRRIIETFAEKKDAMTRLMNYIHFFIQGTQKSHDLQRILANGNRDLFLQMLSETIADQEEFLGLIFKEHVATITALHILHETLESTSKQVI